MSAQIARIVEGKKYVWDGQEYESKDAANTAASTYKNDGFETQVFEDQGKYLVYSRRVVKVVVVEGQA